MKQTVEDNARKGMAIGVSNKQDDDSGSKETGACLRATKLQHHVARSLVEGADKDSSCQVPSTNGQTPIANVDNLFTIPAAVQLLHHSFDRPLGF